MKKTGIILLLLVLIMSFICSCGNEEEEPFDYTSDEYTDTIMDDEGWCISGGILYAYRGDAEEVTVPDSVKTIYNSAFSGDCGHGINLTKITVSGTVENIDDGAFSFCEADTIIIEDGVKTIGSGAFSDSYIDAIFFPASIEKIGSDIMFTEEGLNGIEIHVQAGSVAEKYFAEAMPYGDAKLIVE